MYCVLYSLVHDTEQTPFVVSGTFQAPLNERSAHARQSLIRRMLDPLIAMHTLYWLAGTLLLARYLYYRLLSTGESYACWHTGAVVRLVKVVFAMFVPTRYMIWPPTIRQTEETLTGNSRESNQAGHRYWIRREGAILTWQELVKIVIIIACDWW